VHGVPGGQGNGYRTGDSPLVGGRGNTRDRASNDVARRKIGERVLAAHERLPGRVAQERTLKLMNQAAYEIFQKGHVPIVGANLALPVIEAAGEDSYEEIMMPVSLLKPASMVMGKRSQGFFLYTIILAVDRYNIISMYVLKDRSATATAFPNASARKLIPKKISHLLLTK